jgi:hypothetical protein
MNRPFGAVDVAANLKGAVPKATTQKILAALAEKGEIVQKTYGAYVFINESFLTLRSMQEKRASSSPIRLASTRFPLTSLQNWRPSARQSRTITTYLQQRSRL